MSKRSLQSCRSKMFQQSVQTVLFWTRSMIRFPAELDFTVRHHGGIRSTGSVRCPPKWPGPDCWGERVRFCDLCLSACQTSLGHG